LICEHLFVGRIWNGHFLSMDVYGLMLKSAAEEYCTLFSFFSIWSFNFMFVAHSLSFCPSASLGAMLWILCRSFNCPCPKSGWYMSNSEHVLLVLPQGFSGIVTTAICWSCWLSSKSRVMEKEQCCAPLVGWIIFLRPFLSHSHSSEMVMTHFKRQLEASRGHLGTLDYHLFLIFPWVCIVIKCWFCSLSLLVDVLSL